MWPLLWWKTDSTLWKKGTEITASLGHSPKWECFTNISALIGNTFSRISVLENHRITELLSFYEASKITNCWPITTMPSKPKPCSRVPHPHISQTLSGPMTLPSPWTDCSNSLPPFLRRNVSNIQPDIQYLSAKSCKQNLISLALFFIWISDIWL